jgi:hypothetical protein
MPPRKAATAQATEPPAPPPDAIEPPYYEAAQDLYVWNPESGAVPQLAYRKGDRVVPDVVEPNGWQGQVKVPEQFAGQLTPPETPAPEPDAADGGTTGPADGKTAAPDPAAAGGGGVGTGEGATGTGTGAAPA